MANEKHQNLTLANDSKFAFQDPNSTRDFQLVISALESFFSQPFSPQDLIKIVLEMADSALRCDDPADDLISERKHFHALSDCQFNPDLLASAMGRLLFSSWAARSKNSYAEAFRLGKSHMRATDSRTRQRRATKGRKLIGDNSRKKVAEAAQNLKHLPKSQAALQIAPVVNLSHEKVRSYLSELFPGD